MRRLLALALIALCAAALAGCLEPEPAKTVNTELALEARVQPLGSPHTASDVNWADLCTTPGPVRVPAGQELRLRPIDWRTFGDAELGRLAADFTGLKSLTSLSLVGTRITDAGLAHLTGLTNLKRLDLLSTGVTDAGVAALRAKLPKCDIVHF